MELRQIQYFVQLYKDCNITKASQALFISQQGLSKSIHKLEEELGFTLFQRSVSGVKPTDPAHRLYPYCVQVLDSYHDVEKEINDIREECVLRIVAPHGFSLATTQEDFAEYNRLYPDANTQYKEDYHHLLPQYLISHQADCAFLHTPLPPKVCSHQIVDRDPIYAVMDAKHPLAKQNSIFVKDLANQSFCFLDIYPEINTLIIEQLAMQNLSYLNTIESTIQEFLPAIYASPLIGFSSKKLFQYYNFPGITFLPLVLDDGSDILLEWHLVTLKNASIDRELRRYIEYEREKYKDMFSE